MGWFTDWCDRYAEGMEEGAQDCAYQEGIHSDRRAKNPYAKGGQRHSWFNVGQTAGEMMRDTTGESNPKWYWGWSQEDRDEDDRSKSGWFW